MTSVNIFSIMFLQFCFCLKIKNFAINLVVNRLRPKVTVKII